MRVSVEVEPHPFQTLHWKLKVFFEEIHEREVKDQLDDDVEKTWDYKEEEIKQNQLRN
jgi:hypothetical protein